MNPASRSYPYPQDHDFPNEVIVMPWINLTLRRGVLSKSVQHALMARLTDTLMWWEKVPDTPKARSSMKGWVYEVAEDADYSAGNPDHDKPFYFIEVRIAEQPETRART